MLAALVADHRSGSWCRRDTLEEGLGIGQSRRIAYGSRYQEVLSPVPQTTPHRRCNGLAGSDGAHPGAIVFTRVPDCPIEKVSSAGNAAGTGARIALVNKQARNEIEELVKRIEKVETAVEPRFQEHFIGAIAIPHASEPFPNLAAMVDLPTPPAAGPAPAVSRRSGPSRRRQRLARGQAS